jgi:signal transduction histidine kinase/ActR/RegA family two-component response regulator
MSPELHGKPSRFRARLARGFGSLKAWHLLLLLFLYGGFTITLSTWIKKSETDAATSRLLASSAGASRNLESQFDALRDDFRLLVSLDAFKTYETWSPTDRAVVPMVKRFFARHQESAARIELHLHTGETVTIKILPGNYLSATRSRDDTLRPTFDGSASKVAHDGRFLILSELKPVGMSSPVIKVRLMVDHNAFFKSQLESYLMGQSELWIWSMDEAGQPDLILKPMLSESRVFKVGEAAREVIRRGLSLGLEGIHEHDVFVPGRHSAVSVFNPLTLGDQPMGLVFSSDRDVHLKSLNRLSAFLGVVFAGTVLFLLTWFGISYQRIRGSERAEVRARKKAESADRAKGEFVATMSHEIRTPLNGVLGYAELLRHSGLNPTQVQYLEVIRRSGDHLLAVLNDILDYSRIEAGSLALREEEFSPVGVVEDVIDMLTTAARAKELQLKMTSSKRVPGKLVGDAGRLRQILFNLVGNGIKFTHRGSVEVTVDATDKDGSCLLHFAIVDTGIGIDRSLLDRLFHPFSQIDSSNTRAYQGTGLGLAICKRLVHRMGGEISVETELGKGSRFKFWIKTERVGASAAAGGELAGRAVIAAGEEPGPGDGVTRLPADPGGKARPAAGDPAVAEMGLQPGNRGTGLKVLVVEDNAVNSALLVALLESRGCSAAVAENGTLALELLEGGGYELVFMDIEMPGLDGIETTEIIRSHEGRRGAARCRIVGLSAHAFVDDRRSALAVGMDDYITKPIDCTALDRVIKEAIDAVGSAAEPASPIQGRPWSRGGT